MRIRNAEIAELFNKTADLLEIKGENPFRIRAYRNAAHTIYNLSRDVTEILKNGEDLTTLPGIGKDLAGKVINIIQTGQFEVLVNLENEIPSELIELMKVAGLGGKRVKAINSKLGIISVDQLEKAARDHKVCKLPGFGEKIEKSILENIDQVRDSKVRIRLYDAEEIVNRILSYMDKQRVVENIIVAGSFRRRRETIRDIDILATGKDSAEIVSRFLKYPEIHRVLVQGDTRCTVVMNSGLHVDIRVVPQKSYGAALHYFTGSKDHNIGIRKRGVKLGLKINEYGIFKGNIRIGGEYEKDVFRAVGMQFIEPELREDNGELDAALNEKLPHLIECRQIRGDLHAHTNKTDGHASIEQMVEAAMELGYEYLAITDHSRRLAMTHGLSEKDLRVQIEKIDALNANLNNFRILKGIEVDILENGDLDLPDSVLKELDLTVCSIHSKFNLSRREQTERILRAMEHPSFLILGHPTGRLINRRPPYDIDMERIMIKARENRCYMEINCHPERLDINDSYCRMAREIGVKMSINTDAHSTNGLSLMRFGVDQARRGWLEACDVINTRGLKELKQLLKK